jgi:hypothetical protein
MTYSMYLCLAAATLGCSDCVVEPPETDVNDAMEPALQHLLQLLREFGSKPVSPQAAFDLEQQVEAQLRELGRVGVEWALNRVEPRQAEALPQHVEFEAAPYTRVNHKTPQEVATTFGKIVLWRFGYRPTNKTGDATIFPLPWQLGIVAGATAALAERVARYQAEAGATPGPTHLSLPIFTSE